MTPRVTPKMPTEPHTDAAWMQRAIALAWQAGPEVRPNPRVGCVLVRDGVCVGEGFHARVGGPHAEVVALRAAGDAARGATAYVTLEPCNHHGRTPPCVDGLLAAGVTRVVCACRDPHPQARGGLDRLAAAGVEVLAGVCEAEAAALLEVFLVNTFEDRAHVRLKLAASLDGRTAARDGSSRWITGPQARELVHRQRAEADAVVVGSGTALADDPGLDVRLPAGDALAGRRPLRVVFDRRLRLPLTAALVDASRGPCRVYTAASQLGGAAATALQARGVEIAGLDATGDHDFALAALRDLHRRGQHAVYVEGGAALAASLVDAGCADALEVFLAPKLIGPGRGLFEGLAVTSIDQAALLTIDAVDRVGDDLHVRARVRRGGSDVHRDH